jgi:SAM-dependent methyltransferase
VLDAVIRFISPKNGGLLYEKDSELVSEKGEHYPVLKGIPRFVPDEDYTASFGLEWTVHSLTQLDSRTGTHISQERLERCIGRPLSELNGLTVLEAGCGAGRFTELLVRSGAFVHSIDRSVAVEANRANIGSPPNYVVAQADLLSPPFPAASFDLVLCLGVLQHTPSPEASIRALWRMVKPGGSLVVDHYTWSLSLVTKIAPLYRLFLKRMKPARSKKVTDRLVAIFFPLHWGIRHVRVGQMLLSRFSPCLVYLQAFPQLSKEQHFQWCRLDTFDSLTDHYKHLRTAAQIRGTLSSLEASDIWVSRGGNGIEARCRKSET